ncbi:MAG: glycosyltransferase family 2 protein [Gaiellaceae bacterium]
MEPHDVKLVMTLVVRDEVDVVDAQLAYHLNAGVDFIIATDHDSQDGTTEILEAYAGQGCLLRIPEQGAMLDSVWRTHMARLAAVRYEADWIINTDADEFWMPRRGSLKETLAAVPGAYGVVWALTRHFVPRTGDGGSFAERMTARVASPAAINDPTSPYRPHAKAAHRADHDVVVSFGSHTVFSNRLRPLPDWHPADVFHFPFRTLEQYRRKGTRRARGDKPLGQYVRAYQAEVEGRAADRYQSLVVDDAALERGRAAGSLVVDTRLRDALRALGRGKSGGPSLHAPEAGAIAEGAALIDADVVRLLRSVDGLRARVDALAGRRRNRVAR